MRRWHGYYSIEERVFDCLYLTNHTRRRCYEVKCDPDSSLPDGYGERMDRSHVCFDPSYSIVVRTVDNCPCNYPNNAYSNKRWCCHDNGLTHFDLSIWAFERLAKTSWGVMGIQYQEVSCSKHADNPAPAIANPTPPEQPESWMVKPSVDTIYVKRFDSVGGPQGAVTTTSDLKTVSSSDKVSYSSTFHGGVATPMTSSHSASGDSSSSSSDNCWDKTPDTGSCQQQKDWGKCSESWLKDGGYCKATCGLCGSGSSDASAASSPAPTPSPSSSDSCEDKPVPSSISWGNCQQQKDWGHCSWVAAQGYCKKTCSAC